MRRVDREMDREFGLSVIDRAEFGVLAVVDEKGDPYCIPLSIVRSINTLYFHSARTGKKVDIFKFNPKVCISFAVDVKVPEILSPEAVKAALGTPEVSRLGSKVYTTEFASVIARGRVCEVVDESEKSEALQLLCEKYTPKTAEFAGEFIRMSLGRTAVYSVTIDELSAKRKALDSKGEEMKWGRME